MMDLEIRQQAYQFFLEEAPELLEIIETGLLKLNEERNFALIHDLMRSAHSLKGGAATVGLEAIATIAHRIESIFKALYSEQVVIDTELESLLLKAYDCLQTTVEREIAENSDLEIVATAEPILNELELRLGDALQEMAHYIPSSHDIGVDLVASILDGDLVQVIEHLNLVLDRPEKYNLGTELLTQVDVLIGFAELLDLPSLDAIANTALTAYNLHPEKVTEIIALTVADLQAAKENSQTQEQTSPSEALITLAQITNPETPENFTIITAIIEEPEASAPTLEELFVPTDELANLETLLEAEIEPGSNLVPLSRCLKIPQEQKIDFIQPEKEREKILSFKTSVPETAGNHSQSKSIHNIKAKVDLDRLERMNNCIAELVINRNSFALQQEQLQAISHKLQQRLAQLQNLTTPIQDISDSFQQLNVMADGDMGRRRDWESKRRGDEEKFCLNSDLTSLHGQTALSPHQKTLLSINNEDFDSLEMDRYSELHFLIQGIVEEITQFEEAIEDITLVNRQSEFTLKQQQKTLSSLRNELMWARMLPLNTIINHFPRSLRDLAIRYQKPVNLNLSGTEILIDKGILEKLYDPLMHLLRNAFDHGIESPEVRRRQGKPEIGQIEIRAYHQGDRTLIEIKDDGAGLNVNKIATKAMEKGWLSLEQFRHLSQEELLDFIFQPGFSTADLVSELSGRGTGLDVVRSQLQAIKGIVTVTSTPDKGTTFTLCLPLTLAIAKSIVCSTKNVVVALSAATIQEIIVPKTNRIKQLGEQRVLSWREQLLPVYQLTDLLSYGYPVLAEQKSKAFITTSASESELLPILVMQGEKQNFALEVEGFGKEQELVIKPFGGKIKPPDYIYGCTVLGDGSFIPAIDAAALITYVQKRAQPINTLAVSTQITPQAIPIPTVMVIDDSTMMRRTLALTLQKVGCRVLQAKDGQEAIELLEKNKQLQAIISDLEMPNCNGFDFLNYIRQNHQFSRIPVIMLTSRSNQKHQQLAMHLGATAYLNKPYIEQEFLSVLKEIKVL